MCSKTVWYSGEPSKEKVIEQIAGPSAKFCVHTKTSQDIY